MSRGYSLFISHSWSYSGNYDRLISLLRQDHYFTFRDYSVPRNDPIHNATNARALYDAIRRQMGYAQCVLVLAGVYSTYSEWIQKEIKIATTEFPRRKPVIAIEPFGANRTSTFVRRHADEVVAWRTSSIVNAVRRACNQTAPI